MTTLKTFNDKFSLRVNKWNDRQKGLKHYWEIPMGKYTFSKFIIASNSPQYHTASSQISGNVNLNCILKSTLCVYVKWAWQGKHLSPLRKLTGLALWCSTLMQLSLTGWDYMNTTPNNFQTLFLYKNQLHRLKSLLRSILIWQMTKLHHS